MERAENKIKLHFHNADSVKIKLSSKYRIFVLNKGLIGVNGICVLISGLIGISLISLVSLGIVSLGCLVLLSCLMFGFLLLGNSKGQLPNDIQNM